MTLARKVRLKAYALSMTASAAIIAYPLSGALRHAVAGLVPH